MKSITLLIVSLLIVNTSFTQSKKDMEEKIVQLEEKTKNLESEIISIKTNLTNTTTTLGLLSKNYLDLEKLVKDQELLINKLIKQNDSLLKLNKGKQEEEFVSTPKNEEDSIILMIQSYFACKKWEDRLSYVLNPETVKSSMQDYYKDDYKQYKIIRDEINIQGSGYKMNEVFKFNAKNRIVYCKKTAEGFKIDWEASTGHNPKSFPDFLSEKSKKPTTFRMYLQITDGYNEAYNITPNDYYAFIAHTENGGFETVYMKKSTPGASELKKQVADGKNHQVIIEVAFKTMNSEYYTDDFIFISKFLSSDWTKK